MRLIVALIAFAQIAFAKSSPYDGKLMIGQIYPSGKVYLMPLTRDPVGAGDVFDYPRKVTLYPLEDLAETKGYKAEANNRGTTKGKYIPELEGVADFSEYCSPKTYKKDPNLNYAKGKLLDILDRGSVDNCMSTYAGVYEAKSVPKTSFGVIAISEIEVKSIDYSVKGQKKGKGAVQILSMSLGAPEKELKLYENDFAAEGHWGGGYLTEVTPQSGKAQTFTHTSPRGAL